MASVLVDLHLAFHHDIERTDPVGHPKALDAFLRTSCSVPMPLPQDFQLRPPLTSCRYFAAVGSCSVAASFHYSATPFHYREQAAFPPPALATRSGHLLRAFHVTYCMIVFQKQWGNRYSVQLLWAKCCCWVGLEAGRKENERRRSERHVCACEHDCLHQASWDCRVQEWECWPLLQTPLNRFNTTKKERERKPRHNRRAVFRLLVLLSKRTFPFQTLASPSECPGRNCR